MKLTEHQLALISDTLNHSMPGYPDCYDEWSLVKYEYDGDHKHFDTLFEGTEEECRQYAYENYTDKEQTDMCLMDYEGRDWQV